MGPGKPKELHENWCLERSVHFAVFWLDSEAGFLGDKSNPPLEHESYVLSKVLLCTETHLCFLDLYNVFCFQTSWLVEILYS